MSPREEAAPFGRPLEEQWTRQDNRQTLKYGRDYAAALFLSG